MIAELGKPIITIVLSGSCLALDEIEEKSGAIIQAFYPGAITGAAVARLIRGDFSPSGRLPVTFYSRYNALPDFENYSMEGRTYRYMSEKPLYPFGYGLSYASFKYEDIKCNVVNNDGVILINVLIVNESEIRAHEVVEIFYIGRTAEGWVGNPKFMTARRVPFNPGERKNVEFQIEKSCLMYFDDMGHEFISSEYTIFAGSSQPDRRSFELTGKKCLKTILKMR